MTLSFSELKVAKKALENQAMISGSESETAEMLLAAQKITTEMRERKRCFQCERTFNELDMKTIMSRPGWICTACFTSNA